MEFKREAYKSFLLVSIAEIFGFTANFLIIFFLSKMFPPEEFVYYPFSIAFLLFFLIFANFGLATAIVQRISIFRADNSANVSKLISEGFKWILIFSFITTLLLFILSDYFEQLYKMPNLSITLKFTSLYLFLLNIINYFDNSFQGLMNFKLYSISYISLNFLRLLIVILNFNLEIPIYLIIGFFTIVAFFQLLVIICFFQFKYKILSKFYIFNKKLSKNLLAYSFFIFLFLLLQYLITNFNQFILAYYISRSELAYYFITLMFIHILCLPIFVIIRLSFPYISHHIQNLKQKNILSIIYNSIFQYGFLIIIPITFYILYFSEFIVILVFGTEYYPVSIYLKVYIFYLFIKMLIVTGEIFLLASDESKKVFKLSALTAISTIILSFLLIPIYYIYGAIFAVIIPYSLYVIYTNIIVKKKNKLKLHSKTILTLIKCLIISFISLFIIALIVLLLKVNLREIRLLIFFSLLFFGLFFSQAIIFKVMILNEIKDFIHFFK